MASLTDGPDAARESVGDRRTPLVSPLRLAAVVIPMCLAALVGMLVIWRSEAAVRQQADSTMLEVFGLTRGIEHRLAPAYTDTNGDLVADAPSDPGALRDPDVLTFSYVTAQADGETQPVAWREFVADLARRTGKEVNQVVFETTDEQLQALREGRLHVAGLNTGSVPRAVNACGFVPVSTLGRADGSFGITMQLIVPAASLVQTVRDLRGHRLTFTDTTSNSGFKAPVVLLWTDFGLAPDRDYSWGFSFGHEASIRGVADGDLEAAAVASDMLARALGEPDDARRVDAKKLRVIYTSERFPPAALGYAHDLRPELAEAIRGALLEFSWNGTGLDKVFGSDAIRFVPVAYKDDFAIVRRIDDALGYPHDVK